MASTTRRIFKALAFGVLTTAILALWRHIDGAAIGSAAGLAISVLAFSIGAYVGNLLSTRFFPRRRGPFRRRSVLLWGLAMGALMAALFVAIGFNHGANWAASQWGLAVVIGAVIGSGSGALAVGLLNARRKGVAVSAS